MIIQPITIETTPFGPLDKLQYTFTFLDGPSLVLTEYRRMTRKSITARKYETTEYWSTYDKRNSTVEEPNEIPAFVKAKALEKFWNSITVKKWSEWKR